MTYQIIRKTRLDGIHCYFFKVDGETRYSSYDPHHIKNFARGYAGKAVPVTIAD